MRIEMSCVGTIMSSAEPTVAFEFQCRDSRSASASEIAHQVAQRDSDLREPR